MKRLVLYALALGAILGGCQQPSDLEVQTEEYATDLELIPVSIPDTVIVTGPVDSTGVLPNEQVTAPGIFAVNHLMLDRGEGRRGSFAFSRVFVSDSVVRVVLRNVGLNGVDLGTVTLNGVPMVKIPHRISLMQQITARDTSIVRGVEYLSDLTNTYQPLIPYVWAAPLSPYGALTVGTVAPGPLSVQAPVGGSVVSRRADLPIQWKCGEGTLSIVVSVFDPVSKKSVPILQLRPRTNSGRALLPASVLSQFPAAQNYVFTFILANRKEISLTQAATKRMLVQAASVYSVYFEIR